jgi:hypothetical protein
MFAVVCIKTCKIRQKVNVFEVNLVLKDFFKWMQTQNFEGQLMPDNTHCSSTECPQHAEMQSLIKETKDGLKSLNSKFDNLTAAIARVETFILGDMVNDKPGAAQRLRTMEKCLGLIIKIGIGMLTVVGSFAIYLITNRESFSKILKGYLGI